MNSQTVLFFLKQFIPGISKLRPLLIRPTNFFQISARGHSVALEIIGCTVGNYLVCCLCLGERETVKYPRTGWRDISKKKVILNHFGNI